MSLGSGIQKIVLDYFKDIFSSSNPIGADMAVAGVDSYITPEMNQVLMAEISREEVKTALMQFSSSKSPGPDGMTAAFYQKNWDIVGEDIFRAIQSFFRSGNMPKFINHTHIVLIPKVKSPNKMQHLHPISLCNISYKMVAKVLANRLKGVLPNLISASKSAFVSS